MNIFQLEILPDSASTGARLLISRALYDELKKSNKWANDHGQICEASVLANSILIELKPSE